MILFLLYMNFGSFMWPYGLTKRQLQLLSNFHWQVIFIENKVGLTISYFSDFLQKSRVGSMTESDSKNAVVSSIVLNFLDDLLMIVNLTVCYDEYLPLGTDFYLVIEDVIEH